MSEKTIKQPFNIYEELNERTTLDLSSQRLSLVPEIDERLCVVYLQNNEISKLPDTFFKILPNLVYFDVRDNFLTDIPKSIKNHTCLTHLLLQNNKITTLPNELGTVSNLKILQLNGNPLVYPPEEIIKEGVASIKNFLNEKFVENVVLCSRSDISEDTVSMTGTFDHPFNQEAMSYNSVIDGEIVLKNSKTMSVRFNEKEHDYSDTEDKEYLKNKGKCRKLAQSRFVIPPYSQSCKYLKPLVANTRTVQEKKIKERYLKDLAIKKHKDLLATRDKILQGRKNLELMKNWRKNYTNQQFTADPTYRMDVKQYPYDTHPEYMTLLTREDIEKDLPDKYRKKIVRRCKPTVPRKSNNDVHLALKIKQLFENLEAIDLNRKDLTPRSEQKMLLSEIQKITEIKQKLTELSTTNTRSVAPDE